MVINSKNQIHETWSPPFRRDPDYNDDENEDACDTRRAQNAGPAKIRLVRSMALNFTAPAAEVVSNSMNEIDETWSPSFSRGPDYNDDDDACDTRHKMRVLQK